MTRRWTAPAALGVVAAAVAVWLVRALAVLLAQGSLLDVLRVPSLTLLYAAGPALLCAVPLVLLARVVLPRVGRGTAALAAFGLAAGVLVGVAQCAVLLGTWPWLLAPPVAWELIGLPATGGLVGGLVASLVVASRGDVATPDPA